MERVLPKLTLPSIPYGRKSVVFPWSPYLPKRLLLLAGQIDVSLPTNLRGLSEYRDRLVCSTIDSTDELMYIMNSVVTTMAF
jgi:hypothetical protein